MIRVNIPVVYISTLLLVALGVAACEPAREMTEAWNVLVCPASVGEARNECSVDNQRKPE